MFPDAAAWLKRELAAVDLPARARVLDAGSSTLDYRTTEQPHIDREIIKPLAERGASITHLDVKAAEGVDEVVDLLEPGLDLRSRLGSFDLVLCTDLLAHLRPEDVPVAADRLFAVVAESGLVALTTPCSYRFTPDPVDHGYRASVEDLAALTSGHGFVPLAAEELRIDHPRYYKGLVSRSSVVPVRGRWVTLPGVSEQVRRRVKTLRWKESCLIARRPGRINRPSVGR